MAKRARERARVEKQEAKREKRLARAEAEADSDPGDVDETALMEEFARLSAAYESDDITAAEYDEGRRRIFEELGIEEG